MAVKHLGAPLLVAASALVGAMSGTALAGTASSVAVSHTSSPVNAQAVSDKAVVRYWSAERMRNAIPIENQLPSRGLPSRLTAADRGAPGKVKPAQPALTQKGLRADAFRVLGATAGEWRSNTSRAADSYNRSVGQRAAGP